MTKPKKKMLKLRGNRNLSSKKELEKLQQVDPAQPLVEGSAYTSELRMKGVIG